MVVKDDHTVEAVVLRNVRGRGRVLALDAAEHVSWRAVFRVAERVTLRRGYLTVEVEAHACVERAGGAKPVEEGAIQGDAVGDLHYVLGSYAIDGAEGLFDPGVHRLWWN